MAKKIMIEKYEADDGRQFDTRPDCELYETDKDAHALVGLTAYNLLDVVNGDGYEDVALCIERLGRRLAKDWQSRGDLQRKTPRGATAEQAVQRETETKSVHADA